MKNLDWDLLILVLVPLILTNVSHMYVVKKNLFSFLKKPISKNLFGENKTWRGLCWITVVNSIIILPIGFIQDSILNVDELLFLGAFFGLTYALFELPNSFIKRRLGVKSGQEADKNKWLFFFMDKSDSALGVTICLFLFNDNQTILSAVVTFFILVAIHSSISMLLVALKIKNRF